MPIAPIHGKNNFYRVGVNPVQIVLVLGTPHIKSRQFKQPVPLHEYIQQNDLELKRGIVYLMDQHGLDYAATVDRYIVSGPANQSNPLTNMADSQMMQSTIDGSNQN